MTESTDAPADLKPETSTNSIVTFAPLDPPPPLFTFQQEDARWLARMKFALVASEMGTGKSAVTITAAGIVRATRILVLCPAIARLNWAIEFDKFSRQKRKQTVLLDSRTTPAGDLVICSYDLILQNAINAWLQCSQWDVLVLDECHYLKATDAERAKRVMGRNGLVHRARHTWMLSGTPNPNHNGELWVPCYVGGHTRLGYEDFLERYCTTRRIPIKTARGGTVYQTIVTGSRNTDELRNVLKKFSIRRRKQDVLKDLPPILYSDVVVEPSPVDIERWWPEVAVGMRTELNLLTEIEEQQTALDGYVRTIGLGGAGMAGLPAFEKSIAALRRYVGLQKSPAIASLIASELEAKAYDKIVIFAWHRDVIVDLQERLKDYKPLTLFGGTPDEKRASHIKKFQNVPKYRVIICNVLAAGTSITLTAAHQIAMVECSFVPGNNAQAVMRVHRIGQTEPVTARFFSLANSTDQRLQQVLKRKTRDLTELWDAEHKPAPVIENPFAD